MLTAASAITNNQPQGDSMLFTTTTDTKKCWICQEVQPLDQFHKNATRADGHQDACKVCWREYLQERRFRREHGPKRVETFTLDEVKTAMASCGADESDVEFFTIVLRGVKASQQVAA